MSEKELIYDSRQGGWTIAPKPDVTFHDCLRAWQQLILAGHEPKQGIIFSSNTEGPDVYTIEATLEDSIAIIELVQRWKKAAVLRSTNQPCPLCLKSSTGRCRYHWGQS